MASRRKLWIKRVAKLVAVVVVVMLLAILIVQTPWGKNAAVDFIAARVSSNTNAIEIGRVTGAFPFHLRVDALRVSDSTGVWIDAKDLAIDAALSALLRGRVHVESVTLGGATVHRRPKREQPPPLRIPHIPGIPDWLRVDALRVDRLRLEKPVVGAEAAFSVRGAIAPATATRRWGLTLELARLDAEGTHARIAAESTADALSLAVDVRDEIVLPGLLEADGPFELRIHGAGPRQAWNGELLASMAGRDLVRGDLRLNAAENTDVSLDAAVTLDDAAFPQTIAEQWGDRGDVSLTGTLMADGLLVLKPLTLTTSMAALTMSGEYHLRKPQLDLKAQINHSDPARIVNRDEGGIPPAAVALTLKGSRKDLDISWDAMLGDARLSEGSTSLIMAEDTAAAGRAHVWPHAAFAPEALATRVPDGVELTFDLARNAAGAIRAADIQMSGGGISLAARGDMDPSTGAVDAEVTGSVAEIQSLLGDEGAQVNGAVEIAATLRGDGTRTTIAADVTARDVAAAELVLSQLTLHADGAVDGGYADIARGGTFTVTASTGEAAYQGKSIPPLALEASIAVPHVNAIVMESLRLSDGQSTLTGTASYALESRDRQVHLVLDAPLHTYPEWMAMPARGRAHVSADATKASGGDWNVALHGAVTELEGLPAALQSLLGAQAELSVDAQVGEVLTFKSVAVQGAHSRADVKGSVNLSTKDLALAGAIAVPKLEVFGDTLGGSLATTLEVWGTVDAPAVEGVVTLDNPTLGPLQGRRAEAQVSWESSRIVATAELTPDDEGAPLGVHGEGVVEDEIVRVSVFEASHGDNRVEGAFNMSMDSKRVDGTVTVTAPDLASLAAVTHVPVGGSVRGEIRVTHSGTAEMTGHGEDITWSHTTIGTLDITADAASIYDAPTGDATIEVGQLSAVAVSLERATIHARGDRSLFTLQGNATGELEGGTPVVLDGAVEIMERESRLRAVRLDGNVGEYPIALQQASGLQWSGDGWQLQPLALTVGDGTLRATGAVSPDAVDIRVELEDAPLSMVQLAGGPRITGRAEGSAVITGAGAAPRGQVSLRLTDVQRPDHPREAPTATIDLEADFKPGSGAVTMDARAGDAMRIQATTEMPVTWSVQPWRFETLEETPLRGEVTAHGDLAALPVFFMLPEHRMAGQVDARLQLGGTRGQPAVTGEATIRDGRYENVENGTILSNLEADLTGQGNTLRLTRLAAEAGPEGTMSAEGELVFTRGEPLSIDTRITLTNARFIHRDDATARATGELRFHGTPADLRVDGKVQASPADVALPEARAAKAPELEIPEVNAPADRAHPEESASRSAKPGVIHLNVHVSAPGRVFVRGRGLDTEWRGDVQAEGTAKAPALRGSMDIVRGTITVLGRRFEFVDSSITFSGESPTIPYLNLHAVAEAGGVTARLAMTGTTDELDLTLSSDPPLPRDEILARVLFGRSLAQITPLQAIQLAHAAATLSGKVRGLPFLAGSSRLGVFDRVELRQGDTLEDAALGVGRYLGEDIYVEVEKGLGAEAGKARVEVQLSPQVSVEGEVGTDNQQGIGVFWKKDY